MNFQGHRMVRASKARRRVCLDPTEPPPQMRSHPDGSVFRCQDVSRSSCGEPFFYPLNKELHNTELHNTEHEAVSLIRLIEAFVEA